MKSVAFICLGLWTLAAWIAHAGAQTLHLELEESANGLDAWEPVDLGVLSISPEGRIIRPATAPGGSGFYRLRVELIPEPEDDTLLVAGGTLPASSPLGAQAVASFRIGRAEVTYADWDEIHLWGEANGYAFERFRPFIPNSEPVVADWFDAIRYCNARSEKEGLVPVYYRVAGEVASTFEIYRRGMAGFFDILVNSEANGYRLPTEAEWEFAARGGNQSSGTIYSGGNSVAAVAWYAGNSGDVARNVKTRQPNELGIYDMSGNLGEWCWDPVFPSPGVSRRIARGGNFTQGESSQRLSSRGWQDPNQQTPGVGFRVARSVPAGP